ncbi:hypothetical protein ABZP36_004088 [Zizania latifolia]
MTITGLVLIGATGGECRSIGGGDGLRVDHGGGEADKEVEEVDLEAIGDDVETFDEVDVEDIDGGDGKRGEPAANGVRGGVVEGKEEEKVELTSA